MGIKRRVCMFLAIVAFVTVCSLPALARHSFVQRIAWEETMDPNTDEITDRFWRWVRNH